MLTKYNIKFKPLLPVIIAVLIVIIIEYFRHTYKISYYDRSLRDIEHIISGIIVPYGLYTFGLKNHKKFSIAQACIAYVVACFLFEFSQFCMRGYLQFDQYLFDMIGIAIIGTYLLYRKWR